jgi:hypothetical protein
MGEKRGFTGKLTYDFEVSALLEVQTDRGTWARVTARDFRSWDGPRRITVNYMDESTKTSVLGEPQPYHGPLYIYGTNTQVEYHESFKPISGERVTAKVRDKV